MVTQWPVCFCSCESCLDMTEGCFKYPLVEQYLRTKRGTRALAWKYLLCRVLTLLTILLACLYLLYYICVVSLKDQFACTLHTGKNDSQVPVQCAIVSVLASMLSLFCVYSGVVLGESVTPPVQCKLVAVGVFRLLSCINVAVYLLLIPVVIKGALLPSLKRQQSQLLRPYKLLPAFSHAQGLNTSSGRYDDLSIYMLFLEENLSELKSYKCLQVCSVITQCTNKFVVINIYYIVLSVTVNWKFM